MIGASEQNKPVGSPSSIAAIAQHSNHARVRRHTPCRDHHGLGPGIDGRNHMHIYALPLACMPRGPSSSQLSKTLLKALLSAQTTPTYSLRPKKSVVLGFRATSLTRFLENTCNIYISK